MAVSNWWVFLIFVPFLNFLFTLLAAIDVSGYDVS